MTRIRLTLFTAAGCHLCHEMEKLLERAAAVRHFELERVDITGDEELEKEYRSSIPVLLVNGRKAFKYRAGMEDLLKKIDAAT